MILLFKILSIFTIFISSIFNFAVANKSKYENYQEDLAVDDLMFKQSLELGDESDDYLDIDINSLIRAPQTCIFSKNQCGLNPNKESNFPMPCLGNNTKPFVLENESEFRLLKETCPDLAKDQSREDTLVCCSYNSLKTTSEGFQQAKAIFSRCPSCWYNFRQSACQATCSPDQSLFINPIKFLPAQKGSTQSTGDVDEKDSENPKDIAVPAYENYLAEDLAQNWYNSCKNVMFPAGSGTVIDVSCLPPPGEECNAYYWLKFLNTNILSPIDVYPVMVTGSDYVGSPNLTTSYTYEEFKNLEDKPYTENMIPLGLHETLPTDPSEPYEFISPPTKSYCSQPEPYSKSNETCSCQDCRNNPDCDFELFIAPYSSSVTFYIRYS